MAAKIVPMKLVPVTAECVEPEIPPVIVDETAATVTEPPREIPLPPSPTPPVVSGTPGPPPPPQSSIEKE